MNLLISRHGIRADKDYIERRLMPGLAGAMGDNPSAVFDIVEIVSILLIPYLKELASSDDELQRSQLLGKILNMVKLDVFQTESVTPTLNRDTMIAILEEYGEVDVPPQVIDEMLKAAGVQDEEADVKLDIDTLSRALTSDLDHYNMRWTDRNSTHYDDIFHGTVLDISNSSHDLTQVVKDDEENGKDGKKPPLRRIFTFSSIDYVAENYTSKPFVIILWVLIVVLYFSYFMELQTYVGSVECTRFSNDFACKVANAIVAWLVIFAQLR